MKVVNCSGSAYQIGFTHGIEAKDEILKSKAFYAKFFQETAQIDWKKVQQIALSFLPIIESRWGFILEEIRGVADGSGQEVFDILALNVRTEIAFGLNSQKETDGCTAMYWKAENTAFLAQNWDWNAEQKQALIALIVNPENGPRYRFITEGGIVGKIGFNEYGVGCCLNAIQAKGVDHSKIPIHLALRLIVTCKTAEEAISKLTESGCSSSAHILVGDATTAQGLEFSAFDCKSLTLKGDHIYHTNHYLLPHNAQEGSSPWVKDSPFRLGRIEELSKSLDPSISSIQEAFKDEKNAPGSICRNSSSTTIFNIVMDLGAKTAKVLIGRPIAPEGELDLSFD